MGKLGAVAATCGSFCLHVGSTKRRPDSELIEEMRRCARGEGFDEQPMPGLDSEALDFRAASESFAPFRKLGRCDLEALRLLTEHQGRKVPTVVIRSIPVRGVEEAIALPQDPKRRYFRAKRGAA